MLKAHSQRFADVEDGYAAYIISVAEFAPKMLKSRLPAITKGAQKEKLSAPPSIYYDCVLFVTAVAVFVLLTATAGAGIITSHLFLYMNGGRFALVALTCCRCSLHARGLHA